MSLVHAGCIESQACHDPSAAVTPPPRNSLGPARAIHAAMRTRECLPPGERGALTLPKWQSPALGCHSPIVTHFQMNQQTDLLRPNGLRGTLQVSGVSREQIRVLNFTAASEAFTLTFQPFNLSTFQLLLMVDPIPEEGEIAAQRIVGEHLGERRRQTPRSSHRGGCASYLDKLGIWNL